MAWRKLARAGGDPRAERRRAGNLTFAAAAERVWTQMRPGWRNPKYARDWLSGLARLAFPCIGDTPVDELTSADVIETLRPVWHRYPATARRLRHRIDTVMAWAVAMELRPDNPCGRIGLVLGRQQDLVQHMPALPHDEVAAAVATVQGAAARPVVKLAFEFLVLTAARSRVLRSGWTSERGDRWVVAGGPSHPGNGLASGMATPRYRARGGRPVERRGGIVSTPEIISLFGVVLAMVWALYREIRLGRTEVRAEVVQLVNAIRAEIGERFERAESANRERFERAESANRERFERADSANRERFEQAERSNQEAHAALARAIEQAESANREKHAEVLRALGAFRDEVRTWRGEVHDRLGRVEAQAMAPPAAD